jgi:GNAT superfamily N-acetyltransferase
VSAVAGLKFETLPMAACLAEAMGFRNANRGEAREREYFEWRYLARPCRQPAVVVWARLAGAPVGAVTVAGHDFTVPGREAVLGVIGDISVSAAQRGTGIGAALLAAVRTASRDRFAGCIVMPNPPAVGPLRRAGWTQVAETRRRAKLLAADGSAHPLARWVPTLLSGGERLARRLFAKRFTLEEEPSPWAAVDAIWQRSAARGWVVSVRSATYVRWRYFEQPPPVAHRLFVLRRAGEPRGYVVTRREHKVLWLEDMLAISSTDSAALLVALLDAERRAGNGGSIHIRCALPREMAPPWGILGFVPRHDPQLVMAVDMDNASRVEPSRWYLTAGDKDV